MRDKVYVFSHDRSEDARINGPTEKGKSLARFALTPFPGHGSSRPWRLRKVGLLGRRDEAVKKDHEDAKHER